MFDSSGRLTWKNRLQKYFGHCYGCTYRVYKYFYELATENCVINQLCTSKQFPACSEKFLTIKDVLSSADISRYLYNISFHVERGGQGLKLHCYKIKRIKATLTA